MNRRMTFPAARAALYRKTPYPPAGRRSLAHPLALLLLLLLFIHTMGDTAYAASSAYTAGAAPRNQTTMYVSSVLAGRHGLCVLLENYDAAGKAHYGLVDTGNAASWSAKAFLQKHGVKSLDFLILTHMHEDHTGNAVWILRNCSVRKVYLKQFDAAWSEGQQAAYEKILRAAVESPSVKQIVGVSYVLSMSKTASPSASAGFLSFLKKHEADKGKFQGLFTESNTALSLGSATARIFNWEIWGQDGTKPWVPGKGKRGRADRYAIDNSDNHFSLGVRVSQGTHRLWIGGDMTNLRLQRKRHSAYGGDEERLAEAIGRVDAAVLNHHGMGGSNCREFLRALSPEYVIYTAAQADIVSSAKGSLVRSTWDYLHSGLHLPEAHILWACSCWNQRMEDPAVTVSSKAVVSAVKDGTDMAHKNPAWKGSLTVPLQLGYTYTSYDLTGDGKADNIRIAASAAGQTYRGMKILVNGKAAWTTSASFTDAQPVTLVRLPGKQTFLCISILSPAGTGTKAQAAGSATKAQAAGSATKAQAAGSATKAPAVGTATKAQAGGTVAKKQAAGGSAAGGQVLALFRYGKLAAAGTAGAGARYGLVCAYDLLGSLPQDAFHYHGTPAVASAGGRITVTCSITEPLCGESSVAFPLVLSGAGLKPASAFLPLTPAGNGAGTVRLHAQTALYGSAAAARGTWTIPAESAVAVTHLCPVPSGTVRYRVVTADGRAGWIDVP